MAQITKQIEADEVDEGDEDESDSEELKCASSPFEVVTWLTRLYEFLEVKDLINMYNVNQFCRTTIESGGIRINKVFDINKLRVLADTPWIFKIFAKRMTKLKITRKDVQITDPEHTELDEFLRLLPTINVGRLTELNIGFRFNFTDHTSQLLDEKAAFFQNVVTLALTNSRLRYIVPFFRAFPMENVCTLILNGQTSKSNWLKSPNLRNIQHLWVNSIVTNDRYINMDEVFMSHPNMTTFRYRWMDSCPFVQFPTVASYVENVDNFGTISINKVNCLSIFKKLKCLELSSKYVNGGDIFEMLSRVQNKHWLKALVLYIYAQESNSNQNVKIDEARSTMDSFTKLTHLSLNLSGDEPRKFTQNILPYFQSVTDVVLSGLRLNRTHIEVAIALLPNIRVLIIGQKLEMPTIFYEELIQICQRRRFDYPIEIHLGENAANEWLSRIGDTYDESVIILKTATASDFEYDQFLYNSN